MFTRDGPFDQVSDFVDRGVECRLPLQQVPVARLLDGCDHAVSDVAFVAHPVAWVEGFRDAGELQSGGVVAAAVDRVGDPRQPAVEVAGDLDVQAGRLVLAGVQLPLTVPGPAREQCSVHDVLGPLIEIVGDRNPVGHYLPQHGGQGRYRSADRRLGHPERLADLGLHTIPAKICQSHDDRIEQSQDRRPRNLTRFLAGGIHERAQLHDLILREACSMIHVRRSVSWN